MSAPEGLERFDPRIADWFRRRYGRPTEVQRLAWEPIAEGKHVLVSAPTGSGKTLTGFLWALDRLATGAWEVDSGIRVLYVSPLKALNADIERNLSEPLAGIAAAFVAGGREPLPPIRVAVRSGDTPPAERQRLLRRPPEILITTPESLNLLLLSKAAPALFAGLRTVILDEVHAVAGNKRGVHLITAVERLVEHAGEFQRLGVSATVRPLERVAAWLGGHVVERGADGAAAFRRREVVVARSKEAKRYDLAVRVPPALAALSPEEREGDTLWRAIAADLRERIEGARSTLVFTNSRRLSEKLTRMINEAGSRELAWSHHGSLSRELRAAVEARLKQGALPALVATSSLELGIDIGALDQVLLVQSPRSLASAAQRVGRAGHGVGETSRARFYPTHARDLLECAVAARAVLDGEIEPVVPVAAPLDLLAQWLLAMTAHQTRKLDDLYALVRASDPFHALSRRAFDLVVEMLAGRYAEARIAELRPRLAVDRLTGEARARPGTVRLLAQSGGTIPDRGYFQLRIEESNAKLGELDEEFVWERALGDSFLLGTQAWRIRRITANEVLVAPARGGVAIAPFWRADGRDRGAHFSERIGALLERLELELDDGAIEDRLVGEGLLDAVSARDLVRLLRESRAALGGFLPHRRRIVFEESPSAGGGGEARRRQLLLYTFWGGTLNRPLALALAAAWEEADGTPLEVFADDDAVLLSLPPGTDPRAFLARVSSERLEPLLRERLEGSGLFGAQFRQNAQRALLLPRAGAGRRTPLWVSRENAKRLLEAVARFEDFPLTLETWRSTLHDELDLPALGEKLDQLARGEIAIELVRTDRPSPLAAGLLWRRTNELMYEDDVPAARRGTSLRSDLLREIALGERPSFSSALVERYRRKVQRLLPGYAPATAPELLEWVKERLWIPDDEWRELLAAIDRDLPDASATFVRELERDGKLLERSSATVRGVLAAEVAERLDRASAERFEEWLRYQPPLALAEAASRWGVDPGELTVSLAPLVAAGRLVVGAISDNAVPAARSGGEAAEVATVGAVETLLRWRRAAARPELRPVPLERLPLFLAQRQGLVERGSGAEALQERMERLFGFPAPAELWESDLLPARIEEYRPNLLDNLFDESPLRLFGAGRGRLAFAFSSDLDLFAPRTRGEEGLDPGTEAACERLRAVFGSGERGFDLEDLLERTQLGSSELVPALWALVWRGELSGDSMRAVRHGIGSGFTAPPASALGSETARTGRDARSQFRRWQAARPPAGRWYSRRPGSVEQDPIVEAETAREIARLMLERYGILFRELVGVEVPGSWARLFRALRALELAGEIVGGYFFDGVPGLQFATPQSVERLRDGVVSDAPWWCSALDPASLCGVDLARIKSTLPRRVATTRLVYRGSTLAAVVRRGGAEIDFLVPGSDARVAELVAPLVVALTRAVRPESFVDVEKIGGERAADSAFLDAFAGFDRTRLVDGGLRLRRRYGAITGLVERIGSHYDSPGVGSLGRERNDT